MVHATKLWVMHGPGWSLPILAHGFGTNLMRLRPTGTLTARMRATVQAKIESISTSNGEDWFAHEYMLRRCADPAEGDPDDLISWTTNPGRVSLTKQPDEMEGFFEEFVRSGYAQTVAEAQIRHGQWCSHIFNRLVAERKPVDFGFASMMPLPVRADWPAIVSGRLYYATRWNRYRSPPLIRKWLGRSDCTMFDNRTDLLLWSIVLKHKRQWWREMFRTEQKRRGKGRIKYFLNTLELLKSKKHELYSAFRDYLAQTRRPFMVLRHSHQLRVSPQRKPLPRVVARVAQLQSRRALSTVDARTGKKVQPKIVGPKVKSVRKVPRPEQGTVDLRNGDGIDDAERDRLRLLYASQESCPESKLLDVGDHSGEH